jgi:hypothetical protein
MSEPGFVFHPSARPCGSVSGVYNDVMAGLRTMHAAPPCGGCTSCCRVGYDIELTPDEAERLPHGEDQDGKPILEKQPDGKTCKMFRDGACSIYPERPLACRVYDCRTFSLTRIFPERLMQQPEFSPFSLSIETREDRICLISCGISAASVMKQFEGAEETAVMGVIRAQEFRNTAVDMVKHVEKSPELREAMKKAMEDWSARITQALHEQKETS